MGAAESTGRLNGTQEEEEEERRRQGAGGSSTGSATWGVFNMLSHGRFYKMSTDGACHPNHGYVRYDGDNTARGPSGYGGILRDQNGNCVRVFGGFFRESDCLTAEFHGIFNGLRILDKLRLQESVLESDSAAAIEWIENEEDRRRKPVIQECWDKIEECKRLIKKNRIIIRRISRDANKCADKLANMGIDKRETYWELEINQIKDLPYEIKSILDHEEEERRRQGAGGSSTGSATAAFATAAAGAAFAAWGVYKMLSDDAETGKSNREQSMSMQAPGVANNRRGEYKSYNGGLISSITGSPSHGRFYKMSTDGACRPNHEPSGYVRSDGDITARGPSGYGGILRDPDGKWVRGFRGFIGESDCLTAEFHGIFNGLLILDKLGFQESVLESDSAAAIEWIECEKYRRRTPVIQECWKIVEECKRLIKKNRITILTISRDANKCADKLANMGIDKQEPYCVEIVDLPYEINSILDRESSTMV